MSAPSNTALFDRATRQFYVPAVNGAQSNFLDYQASIVQKGPCQNDLATYFPTIPSGHVGEWTCDPLTGRNYWSDRADNNYLPDYEVSLR